MALSIVKVMNVGTKQGNKTSGVIQEIPEDTFVARNNALQTLGFTNTTGRDPDLTSQTFINRMKEAYPSIVNIRVETCIKDNDTGKFYFTYEITGDKLAVDELWIAPETKKKDLDDRKGE